MSQSKLRTRGHIQNKYAFKEMVRDWAKKMKVRPNQIRIQKMSSKWASCSSKGWVSFSEDLLNEHSDFQEYVIVHELLHLRVSNHGKLFSSLLSLYLPDWEERARSLQSIHKRSL